MVSRPSPACATNSDGLSSGALLKKAFERSYLLQALTANEWNISKTAEVIGMQRSLLYRKMEKYGIKKGG